MKLNEDIIKANKMLDGKIELDVQFVLKHMSRRVKWLYNNNNKNTMVYDEKMIRLLLHKWAEKYEREVLSKVTKT